MRIIVDERTNRRTAKPPIPADDAVVDRTPNPAEAFRYPEKQLNCRVCRSRLAFREVDDAVVVVTAQNWTVTCPVDATINRFNPLTGKVEAPVV